MRRVTRKKLKQDEFVSIVDQMIQWISENWRPVLAALGAVVVVFLLWWGLSSWSGSRRAKASEMLAATVEKLDTARGPEDRTAVEQELRTLIEHYGRTPQGNEARILLARLLIEDGKIDEARTLLNTVAQRKEDSAIVRVATLDLIHLRVASGQAAEVAQELQAMVAGKDPRLPRDVALYELALVSQEEGNLAQAREYFQKLVDDFPESPYAAQARQRLQELG
jgi:predicted negative regulator of RcsB-dependent stress response